ncbi:MAG: hypothetical protein KC543_13720, partial [Myxococcales bacterium]|nr:hypothetical protein [Myxococcales bacterium]
MHRFIWVTVSLCGLLVVAPASAQGGAASPDAGAPQADSVPASPPSSTGPRLRAPELSASPAAPPPS